LDPLRARGLDTRLEKGSFALDLLYIASGVLVFVAFGLYALLLKRV
jgi:hypothetical protein